jgi:hypothetical protein
MKKAMKKLMAALLAVAMVCAMAIPAFAASGSSPVDKGSITINKAVAGEDYTIYKMFDLTSFDTDAGTYSYTVVSAWDAFFAAGATGHSYIELENGHPTWVGVKDAETYEQFAKDALAYATQNSITATKTATATDTTVKFDGLDLGYYLVDTSLGVLCGLDTTKPNATINEKNNVPTIDKEVKNSEGNWVDENTAKIGDTVNYKVTITVQTANNRYVLHDTMSEGLTFNKDSVKVTVGTEEVAAANYEVVTTGIGKETFNVNFKDEYIATLPAGTDIVVTYDAVVNEKAKIDSDENENEAHLVYGNKHETEKHKTKTYLYEFDLIKFNGSNGKLLGGAQFKLYDAKTGGSEIKLVENADGTYRVATADEITGEKTVDHIETVAGKTVKISGLDKKVYWLAETVPPAGFNALPERAEVDLTHGSKKVTTEYLVEGTYNEANADSIGGVAVENNAGTTLPGTGGIGTTIFYVVGGGLMAAAAILLITKKRMENR